MLALFLLFCRYLPMVAMAELKTVMPAAHAKHGPDRYDYQPDPEGAENGATPARAGVPHEVHQDTKDTKKKGQSATTDEHG